jgi:hypothetical protein
MKWTDEEVKEWILDAEIPPLLSGLSIHEQIVLTLEYKHFERVRVERVPHHPVYRVTAQLGKLAPQSLRPLKLRFQDMCRHLGFTVKIRDIIAEISRGRVEAVFALLPPNPAPVVVEDDEWLPEYVEVPD